jgi:hypothetical protein
MPVSKEFILAWQKWLKFRSSYSTNHSLRRSVMSEVVLDLDHIESYLYGIGLSVIEGKNYKYAEIASRELSELQKISAGIERCDISENDKEIFRQHIDAVNAVWKLILEFSFNNKAAPETSEFYHN